MPVGSSTDERLPGHSDREPPKAKARPAIKAGRALHILVHAVVSGYVPQIPWLRANGCGLDPVLWT